MRKKAKQKRISDHNGLLSLTNRAALMTYDSEADAAYFSVRKGKVARTIELQKWLLADVDVKGGLLGVEMLFASRQLPPSRVREFTNLATPFQPRRQSVHAR